MKTEFQNSVVRSSFLCRIKDIKIAWINLCYLYKHTNKHTQTQNLLKPDSDHFIKSVYRSRLDKIQKNFLKRSWQIP